MEDTVANDHVNSEIVCTLAALGYAEDNEYYRGDDCLGLSIINCIRGWFIGREIVMFKSS